MPVLSLTTLAPPARALSLPELTDIALTNNPATHVAWSQIQIAAASLGIAKSAYWPTLGLGADVLYDSGQSSDDFSCSINNALFCSNKVSYGPSLSLNYLLLDFGSRAAQVKNARYVLEASQLSQNAAIQQVIFQVEQAYYQVLGQQALVEASKITVKQTQTNLKSAQALHHQGMVTMGDIYQAQSELAQAEVTLQQAQGAFAIAQGQLSSAMGIPIQTPLQIAKLSEKIQTKPIMQSIDHLLTLAKKQRPDLQAAESQIKAADAQVTFAQKQQWPTLQLNVESGQTFPNNSFNNNGQQTALQLSINLPLFTGFQQTYAINQAKSQQQLAVAQKETLSNQIELQVWQAYYALQTAEKAFQSSRVLLETSIQAAKQAYGQYKAGVGNILLVVTTQSTEASARAQYIQNRLNWYIALAQLSAALGILTPDSVHSSVAFMGHKHE